MYRILTEHKNIGAIRTILGRLGLNYTTYAAEGMWKGCSEPSLILELDDATKETAEYVAKAIKHFNQQAAVLLQEIPVLSRLI